MKSIRSTSQPQGLALLQALPVDPRLPPRVAVLEAELIATADGWHQLLPAGHSRPVMAAPSMYLVATGNSTNPLPPLSSIA